MLLLELTRDQNSKGLMDIIYPGDESILSMDGFVKKLNDNNFIFFDEQHYAYREPKKLSDHNTFGMIYSNFCTSRGRRLRIILSGSKQTSFETSLNGEYGKCLKYV